MTYKVPLVERIKVVYLVDGKTGFSWGLTLISRHELSKIINKKDAKIFGTPHYVTYEHDLKNGVMSFYPIPDKFYDAKCIYIETKEF